MILSIDPGKRSLAYALWGHSRRLVKAGIVQHRHDPWWGKTAWMISQLPSVDEVVAEFPKVYPYERRKSPNDLLPLAANVGACSALGELVLVTPQEWKGQMPKDVCHRRILQALGEDEVIGTKNHNVMDAVGIGLWYLGRLHV